MMRLLASAVCLLLLASPLGAADPPKLSEAERLTVELLTVKAQLARAIADADACRVELQPVRTAFNALAIEKEAAAVKAAIDAAHPGYQWNPKTGALDAVPENSSAKGTP